MTTRDRDQNRSRCLINRQMSDGGCLLSNVLKMVDVGIAILDASANIVLVLNEAASDILDRAGVPKEYEPLRSTFLDISEGIVEQRPKYTQQMLRRGGVLIGYSVYVVDDTFECVFLRDITERARLEAIEDVVNISDNMEYVFSCLRHEIGNPINTLKTTLTVLHDGVPRYSEHEIIDSVGRALNEIGRLEHLLQSLKKLSMFDKFSIEPVSVPGFVAHFIETMTDEFEKGGVTVRISHGPRARTALIDPQAFHQVLLNVVKNSIEALEGVDAPQIEISTKRLESGLIGLVVADNGCGIEPEAQSNLFKPFFTSKESGTGLGLVLARKMLAAMNGQIEIESTPSQGTAVTITVPAQCAADESPARTAETNTEAAKRAACESCSAPAQAAK